LNTERKSGGDKGSGGGSGTLVKLLFGAVLAVVGGVLYR
jgi:hypothetical protein